MLEQFFNTFIFMFIPFITVSLYSLILPTTGAFLYLRQEIIITLALPAVATGILAIHAVAGLFTDNNILLILSISIEVFLLFYLSEYIKLPKNKRDLFYASLFTIGNFVFPLLASLSSSSLLEKSSIFKGELLSISQKELIVSIIFLGIVSFLFFIFKNAVFSLCIDEENMKLRTEYFIFFSFFYKMIITFTITLSTLFVGPILTSSLLIIPSFFSELRSNSLHNFLLTATIIGILSSLTGFTFAVMADLPPAYSCSFTTLCCAICISIGPKVVMYTINRFNKFFVKVR